MSARTCETKRLGDSRTKLSPTQQRILEAASEQTKNDVREHMRDIKSPAIRNKVVESMLKHGLITEASDADGVVYIVSDAGFAAIGKTSKILATNIGKEKPKPERTSKKNVIIALLQKGATLVQIVDATGWQKHSVHGALA